MTSPVIDAGDDLPLTFPALLARHTARFAERTLLVCDDQRLTYAEAEARSRSIAKGLIAAGVVKGVHVGLLYPNGPGFVAAAFAAARIGAVVVPFSTFSTVDELRWLIKHSDCGYLISTPEFRTHRYAEELPTALPGLDFAAAPPLKLPDAPSLRRVWLGDVGQGGEKPDRHAGWTLAELERSGEAVDDALLAAMEARVSPADRLVIVHTSGSTSTPKGVMHTHGGIIRHIDNLNQIRRHNPNEIMFSNSPFFWIGGFVYTLLGSFEAGARLLCTNATDAGAMLDFLERERPTTCNGYAQTMLRLAAHPSFAKRDLSTMRRGNLYPIMPEGSRPADPELRHGMFGMTETGSTVTTAADEGDIPERLRGSYGRFAPGFETRISDPETGQELPPGEVGELWLRGPLLMEGYYGKTRDQVFDRDGWWHSGDLAAIDAEGWYYFKGRRGDMIKTAGANVAPLEVEAALRTLAGERQCIVFGLPDPARGQVVTAVVVAEQDTEVDEATLKKQLAAKLSSYKIPRRILRLAQAEVPVMSSGKIDMRRLSSLVQQRLAA
jgi:acyl-CoA synthetase (AMP-forming)/AMP-acid ligase II